MSKLVLYELLHAMKMLECGPLHWSCCFLYPFYPSDLLQSCTLFSDATTQRFLMIWWVWTVHPFVYMPHTQEGKLGSVDLRGIDSCIWALPIDWHVHVFCHFRTCCSRVTHLTSSPLYWKHKGKVSAERLWE